MPGAKHGNADTLSRCPCLPDDSRHCDQLEVKEPTVQTMELTDLLPSSRRTMQQLAPHWSVKDLQQAQLEDNATAWSYSKMAKEYVAKAP